MPRSASTGVYTAPSNSFNPAVTNTTISATAWNATSADYVTALAHTASTTRALYPTTGQVQDGAFLWGGTAGGTADALTITLTPAITAYAAGQTFRFVAATANATATPTLAVNGLAATVITRSDGLALLVGDIPAGSVVEVVYNGASFRLSSITASQAVGNDGSTTTSSATSINLTSASSRVQAVTMTADAQSVFLPDARTLSVGGVRYIINNTGGRTFGVRSANSNLFTNSNFAAGTSWTAGTGWAIEAGVATKTAGVQSDLTQAVTTVSSTSYVLTFTITTISGGGVRPVLTGSGADVLGTSRTAPGTYTETLVSAGNTLAGFRGDATFAGSIDNVSITQTVTPLLAVLPPGATAECSLTSAATISGAWVVTGRDLQPALSICENTFSSSYNDLSQVCIRLTDTLSLFFIRSVSAGQPFVYAVNHGTYPATVGTPVLIVASGVNVEHAFRITDSKAFIKVDGATNNCYNITVSGTTCTVSSAATAASLNGPNFTDALPAIVAMGANNDIILAVNNASPTITAQAVDASGANPVAGTAVNVSALGAGSTLLGGLYKVTSTTALLIYMDNTGTTGSPFSLRGVVISLSGTTVSIGTSSGINDIITSIFGSASLTANSYVVGYYNVNTTTASAVAVTVTGTTVTFGTPAAIENTGAAINALSPNRFNPAIATISSTACLMSYNPTSIIARHVILAVSAGVITVGTIRYNLFKADYGANWPPTSAGFLCSTDLPWDSLGVDSAITSIAFNGNVLDVAGSFSLPGFSFSSFDYARFNLSGGVYSARQSSRWIVGPSNSRSIFHSFKFQAGNPPQYMGSYTLNNWFQDSTIPFIPIEISPFKAAFFSVPQSQNGTTNTVLKLNIMEFVA